MVARATKKPFPRGSKKRGAPTEGASADDTNDAGSSTNTRKRAKTWTSIPPVWFKRCLGTLVEEHTTNLYEEINLHWRDRMYEHGYFDGTIGQEYIPFVELKDSRMRQLMNLHFCGVHRQRHCLIYRRDPIMAPTVGTSINPTTTHAPGTSTQPVSSSGTKHLHMLSGTSSTTSSTTPHAAVETTQGPVTACVLASSHPASAATAEEKPPSPQIDPKEAEELRSFIRDICVKHLPPDKADQLISLYGRIFQIHFPPTPPGCPPDWVHKAKLDIITKIFAGV